MKHGDLHGFIRLEAGGDLRYIRAPVDLVLEVTEIRQRTCTKPTTRRAAQ